MSTSSGEPDLNRTMAEPIKSPRKAFRMGRITRMLLPSLATLLLAAALVFTIFFTVLDWQWIAFLSGILCAAILSLVSASWKAQWRVARRTAQLGKIRERLAAEMEGHRLTSERLDRELALRQQDRERLARGAEAQRSAEQRLSSARDTLRMLELHLPAAACFFDGELRSQFHTRAFAASIGKHSSQLDGRRLDEMFDANSAEAVRGALGDALQGRIARAEMSAGMPGATATRRGADFIPQRDAAGNVTGILMVLREAAAAPPIVLDEPDTTARRDDAARAPSAGLRVTDETGHAVYLRSLTEELTGWSDSQARIREAIDRDLFDLYAQDIVALRPELRPARMLELLIRMRDEEELHLPPGAFLPAAEHFGLMPDIDRWVVKKVVSACAAVDQARRTTLALLCINVARSTIEDRTFPAFVAATLAEQQVSGHLLCFEIADSDVIAGIAEASRFATEVKRLGCKVSLDGFGAAGVGFDHVKTLPLDFLKIDGRIVLSITRDPVALAKVNAIARVCRGIGVRTVAEMVESDDVMQKLGPPEVDYAQGFGIAVPRALGVLV